ncbi:hypothetical protein DYBT9275_04179 [Dyadobacter sp. CECT 9275]|uniref:O-antigen ligase-related domain-containing protein n=1 Tax=Dyadobacter helix TaxID=2822344 RepID=A0A916JDZ0_9BACT|nr:O-antigen ligase family protein [Dyadobacter sp. CECT 9275]CAG5008030.1 hypothetical protein DYBT9275_04179 [Dyadobacter sp. CECT 9275]
MTESISKETIFRLLFLNIALVIVGYALGVLTGKASVGVMRIFKYLVLLLCILQLFSLKNIFLDLITRYSQGVILLAVTVLACAVFTPNPALSAALALTFSVPFLYIVFAVSYLLIKYPVAYVLNSFLSIINWVYMLPIVSFFITGGSLTDTNIYYVSGENEDSAFVSNHYGWSGTIFLITGIDLLRNTKLPYWRKILLIIFGVISLYIVLISGNRTSWLSLLLVSMVFLFRYQSIPLLYKCLLLTIPVMLVLFLLADSKSALNNRFKKTEGQAKKGEARVRVSAKMISHFSKNPALFVTGIGMFNKSEIKKIINWSGYHNSYFEVLFGAGLPVFLFFVYLLLVRPAWNYIRYFSQHYLFLPPFLIIPYFESNLTGGQFLFFPWFILVIIMSYAKKFTEMKASATNTTLNEPVSV